MGLCVYVVAAAVVAGKHGGNRVNTTSTRETARLRETELVRASWDARIERKREKERMKRERKQRRKLLNDLAEWEGPTEFDPQWNKGRNRDANVADARLPLAPGKWKRPELERRRENKVERRKDGAHE